MSPHIPLGPFLLDAPLGAGGMAEVWRGRHARQGLPVAVKVITARHAREPGHLAALKNEVRAVARLSHPNVVHVLDYGVVDEEAASASGGRLVPGSPYLAMELASGGTLARAALPVPWAPLRATLLAILDALAHAHAHGVVHLDLKPANVLLCTDDDARPGLKLSDFGMAHVAWARAASDDGVPSGGTPRYMAPEQLDPERDLLGPAADLYALGVVAYQLASGAPPFSGSITELIVAHVTKPPPRLVPRVEVPEGFVAWVHRLLEKKPHDRFACAADAAFALRAQGGEGARRGRTRGLPRGLSLVDDAGADGVRADGTTAISVEPTVTSSEVFCVSAPGTPSAPLALASAPTLAFDDTDTVYRLANAETRVAENPVAGSPVAGSPVAGSPVVESPVVETCIADTRGAARLVPDAAADVVRPPLPADWRDVDAPPPDLRLVGAGLGLFGLRALPVVGREALQDVLWRALSEVHAEGRPRVVGLRGAAGRGKSHLAAWLCARAEEVGAARALKVPISATAAWADDLGRAVARTIGALGASPTRLSGIAGRWLAARGVHDDDEQAALVSLAWAGAEAGGAGREPPLRFVDTEHRHAAFARFLELWCVDRFVGARPIALWLDDAHLAGDAAGLARALLERASLPVVVLLTARQDEHGEMSSPLDALARRPGVLDLEVPPLDPSSQRRLVEELLHLERGLAEQVRLRSGGNPLFAVQLVGDWVQRGVLEVGPRGFVLRPGEAARLPDDLHALWSRRLARVLDDDGEDDDETGAAGRNEDALELAAVLGREVREAEWSAALQERGLAIPHDVVEAMIEARLAVRTEDGFGFVHGMLQESLERRAREAGRLARHHEVAARALRALYGEEALGVPGRIGHHLLCAGRPDEAAPLLYAGAASRFEDGELLECDELLTAWRRAALAAGLGHDDEAFGKGRVLHAEVLCRLGRFDEALSILRELSLAVPSPEPDSGLVPRRFGAGPERRAGESEPRAGALSRELSPAGPPPNASALVVEADVLYQRGDLAGADGLYARARSVFEAAGDLRGVTRCLFGRADVAYYVGRRDEAEALYREALARAERSRDVRGAARALWSLGYVAMWRGQLDLADKLFRRQQDLAEREQDRHGIARAQGGRGEVARLQGRLDEAEAIYAASLAILERIGARGRLAARLNVAHVQLDRGRFGEARRTLLPLLIELREVDEKPALGTAAMMLAAVEAATGDLEEAERRFDEAARILEETAFHEGEIAQSAEVVATHAEAAGVLRLASAAWRFSALQWSAIGEQERAARARAALERAAAGS